MKKTNERVRERKKISEKNLIKKGDKGKGQRKKGDISR